MKEGGIKFGQCLNRIKYPHWKKTKNKNSSRLCIRPCL